MRITSFRVKNASGKIKFTWERGGTYTTSNLAIHSAQGKHICRFMNITGNSCEWNVNRLSVGSKDSKVRPQSVIKKAFSKKHCSANNF